MKSLMAACCLALVSTVVSAEVTYDVNRAVGSGTVVGTVQTNGRLGVLSSEDILDWSFTLSSAHLSSGSPVLISMSAGYPAAVAGNFLVAAAGHLSFDFSGGPAPGYLLFQDGSGDYWCVQTNGCFNSDGAMEAIGFGPNGPLASEAESAAFDRPQVIATAAQPVPEPSAGLLLAGGLALLRAAQGQLHRRGVQQHRRRPQQQRHAALEV